MEQHEQNLSYRILQSSKLVFFLFCFLFYLMIIIVFLSFQFFVCLKDLNCKISLKCPYSQCYDKNHASNFIFIFFFLSCLDYFSEARVVKENCLSDAGANTFCAGFRLGFSVTSSPRVITNCRLCLEYMLLLVSE